MCCVTKNSLRPPLPASETSWLLSGPITLKLSKSSRNILTSSYFLVLHNPFCGGLLTPMRYDLERGGWSRGGRLGARGSRRGPTQVQLLLFRFRGFSSVKDLGNDLR